MVGFRRQSAERNGGNLHPAALGADPLIQLIEKGEDPPRRQCRAQPIRRVARRHQRPHETENRRGLLLAAAVEEFHLAAPGQDDIVDGETAIAGGLAFARQAPRLAGDGGGLAPGDADAVLKDAGEGEARGVHAGR